MVKDLGRHGGLIVKVVGKITTTDNMYYDDLLQEGYRIVSNFDDNTPVPVIGKALYVRLLCRYRKLICPVSITDHAMFPRKNKDKKTLPQSADLETTILTHGVFDKKDTTEDLASIMTQINTAIDALPKEDKILVSKYLNCIMYNAGNQLKNKDRAFKLLQEITADMRYEVLCFLRQ